MTTAVMGIGPLCLGIERQEQATARLAWFLAGAYPGPFKRKRIARDFKVSEETAKGWLTGKVWPSHRNFMAINNKYGDGFLAFIYGGNVLTPLEMERQTRAAKERAAEMIAKGEQARVSGEIAFQVERMALALDRRNSALRRAALRLDGGSAGKDAPEDRE